MPNIQDKHFRFDEENEEYTCKTCGSSHSELEAIMHVMKAHGYHRIDIVLDNVKEE